jgi:hypothetical protein
MGTAMNCEHYNQAIGELIDGTIAPARRRELDDHLASCESCRAVAADLRQIREVSARLPVHRPSERVWEHLSARLPVALTESPGRTQDEPPRGGFFSALLTPRWRLAWGGGLAAAVAALVLVAVFLPRDRPTAPRVVATTATRPQPAGSPSVHAGDADLVQSVESELRMATQHYEKAIGGLEQMATAGEGTLDPKVAGAIRQNLTVLDRAIGESRTALQNQPTNELAQESLFEAFRRKVGLLQDTVALINEMRKGNQAEAAKILGNMKK